MTSTTKHTLIKAAKSILAFVSIMFVAISGHMAAHPVDKTYPLLLLLSVGYLQWVSWDFFFEIVGIPTSDEARIRGQFKTIFKTTLLGQLVPFC